MDTLLAERRTSLSATSFGGARMSSLLPRTSSDDALLPRIAKGDEGAVEACLDRYGDLVWRIARRLVGDADTAADVVQEAFIDIWRAAPRFDPEQASERTFVAMIARRRVIDGWRARQRHAPATSLAEPTAIADAPSRDRLEESDEVARIQGLLSTLDPIPRQVLRLAVLGGWPHRQIATELGLPLGTVKSHIRRALLALRSQLGVRDGTPPPEGDAASPSMKDGGVA